MTQKSKNETKTHRPIKIRIYSKKKKEKQTALTFKLHFLLKINHADAFANIRVFSSQLTFICIST